MSRATVITMPTEQTRTDRTPLREDFIRALYWLLDERGVSHRQLADDLGWGSHTRINVWRNLKAEPEPWEVFELEEYLRVPPGTLSKNLGYMPPGIRSEGAATVLEAIDADAQLPEWGRRLLKSSYNEILNSRAGRRRG